MTYAQVKTMLSTIPLDTSSTIPTAYYQFPDDTPQKLPFICFFYSNNNDFLADNENYQKIEHLVVELYTENKDFTLEAAVEAVLSANGLVYTRNEQYLDSERMQEVIYETDVIITEETNG